MRYLYTICIFLLAQNAIAQKLQRFEEKEFSGVVEAILPGYTFAYERLVLNVSGKKEFFVFAPLNGKLITTLIKVGQPLTLKAMMDLKGLRLQKRLDESGSKSINKTEFWFLLKNFISEIKVNEKWIKLEDGPSVENIKHGDLREIILDKKVNSTYESDGYTQAVMVDDGIVAFNGGLGKYARNNQKIKPGDNISFAGMRMPVGDGFQYPVEGVKRVYFYSLLSKEDGKLVSLLFKQNNVCIGIKVKNKKGKELMFSFPTHQAMDIKKFIQEDEEASFYFSPSYKTIKFDLPELHAIVQGSDTLFINEFGFYGGADGEHEHKNIELKGKVTRINKSEKGNVLSIIVDSEYYVEIDAMMAQQLGNHFEKGKELIVAGKERVKKVGEIYSKDYRIIAPEKIAIDGKYFSLYQP